MREEQGRDHPRRAEDEPEAGQEAASSSVVWCKLADCSQWEQVHAKVSENFRLPEVAGVLSLLPKVYERVIAIEKMSNPAASTQFYLYAAVEDYVLDAWDQDLMRRRPKHISLHFDCIRVGGLDQRFLHRCCVTRLLQRC